MERREKGPEKAWRGTAGRAAGSKRIRQHRGREGSRGAPGRGRARRAGHDGIEISQEDGLVKVISPIED
ncbi:hypothetical protein, partial [Burkholderia stabilis]